MSPSAAVAHDGGAYVTAAVQQPLRGAPHPLRPLRGAYTAAAPSIVSAIATDIAEGDIMNPLISAITRTARSLRRSFHRIVQRLTRKAKIKLGLTFSLPPFVKIVFDYQADLGEAANDNRPNRRPRHTA